MDSGVRKLDHKDRVKAKAYGLEMVAQTVKWVPRILSRNNVDTEGMEVDPYSAENIKLMFLSDSYQIFMESFAKLVNVKNDDKPAGYDNTEAWKPATSAVGKYVDMFCNRYKDALYEAVKGE